MQNNTFGVALYNGEYRDVSNTERGAKNYATRHGFKVVYVRFSSSCNIALKSYFNGKKWVNTPNVIKVL